MTEPIFWLACSLLLVAVCLTAVLIVAIPAFQELARASRSAEKLFDVLYRELPPTLEAIRLTGVEITDLTDDLSSGVVRAGNVVQQVDHGLRVAQRQVKEVSITTQSFWTGAKTVLKSLMTSKASRRRSRSLGLSTGLSTRGDRPQPDRVQTSRSTTDHRSTTNNPPAPLRHAESSSPRSPEAQPETRPLLEDLE